jgi:hypothetical protein
MMDVEGKRRINILTNTAKCSKYIFGGGRGWGFEKKTKFMLCLLTEKADNDNDTSAILYWTAWNSAKQSLCKLNFVLNP